MIDHVALLPAYLAAGTAVLILLADLAVPGRRAVPLAVAVLGFLATAAGAVWLGGRLGSGEQRATFCADAAPTCSYVVDDRATVLMAVFAALALGVVLLSVGVRAPIGEYCFLLACSMTGGVVLAGSADLITLIVALETLTLPLYVLVGLRRGSVASAEAAVTFLVVSVVATAVSLLGAALVYASTGAVHFGLVRSVSASAVDPALRPLAAVGTVLLLGGLGFKVAAVPLHAWAPATYDGAPLPVAAYLSTASKLGGVVAIAYVVTDVVTSYREVAAATVTVLALLTMTVGNLVALRQRRMVRLLAWSSIAQAGYILAALAAPDGAGTALAYTMFYVLLELAAFGAVIGLRGDSDGGDLADYAGTARRAPWRAAVLVIAFAGLAGLPPGFAGLFAKVAVVRVLVDGGATWLAVAVALNAVVGLAYYVRAAAILFAAPDTAGPAPAAARRPQWTVVGALVAVTVVGLVIGFAPQLVFDVVASR
jgi:NADH-quinone oxidoreductase subunit N